MTEHLPWKDVSVYAVTDAGGAAVSEKVCGHIGDAWICMSKVGHDGDHRHENRPLEVVRCLDWIGRQLAQPDLRSEFLKEWTQEAEVAAEERGRRRGVEEERKRCTCGHTPGCAIFRGAPRDSGKERP